MAETAYANESTPIVDPITLEFRRAITTPEMGYSCIQRLKQDSWYRNEKQAAIMAKYNDEPPYNQAKLDAAKQGWRRNASTCFMSVIIKRILPSYNQVIDKAQYLTVARFPNSETQEPDVTQKELDFRAQITFCIRSWLGWQAFKSQVILENLLFGYSGAGWTDEVTWEPRFLRQDEAYFPDGSSQEARLMPLWCLDQNFQIHEMAAYLVNPEASLAAGWNIENIVTAINDAKPANPLSGTNPDVRKYQDMIRGTSLGMSYSEGVKVVKAVHLFVQEVSGKVSHYIYDDRTKKQLFCRLDRFEFMEQNLSLMAIEVGNGKLHGSKGAGRILYNMHVSVDQARNLIFDNLMLSGLLVLKAGDGAKPQQALTVMHPVAVIGKGYEVVESGFQINTEAFFAIDDKMTSIAEQAIGAFIPGQVENTQGEKRTASEINYTAAIEQELKEGNLARFWAQYQLIITEIQKRICSVDNIAAASKIYEKEKNIPVKAFTTGLKNLMTKIGQAIGMEFEMETDDVNLDSAVSCCLAMLRKGLTPKDIYVLGQAPSYDLTTDTAADLSAAYGVISEQYAGNPNVDQVELTKRRISSMLGAREADAILIPAQDNTLAVEGTAKQLMELNTLNTGEPLPISPRDFDVAHMDVIMAKADAVMKNPETLIPGMIPIFENIFAHFEAHLQQAIGKTNDKASLQKYIEFDKAAKTLLQHANVESQKLMNSPAAQPNVMPAAHVATNGAPQAPAQPNSTAFTHRGPQPPQVLDNGALAAQKKPLQYGPPTSLS